jgi:peptidoglycan lytic transglycosylase
LRALGLFTALLIALLLAGCGGKKRTTAHVPPPPTQGGESTSAEAGENGTQQYENARPIYTETGIASWYGPPYHHRRTSNGEIYDQNGLTAAHRTLPLNSVARVTNVRTGRSAEVRITDRGPFIEGRMLDLSLAAAKKIDVWRAGTAEVRMEVLHTPVPIDKGGRWCVQIGAFDSKKKAEKLKDKLERRYPDANVLQFTGPTGEWLRIRFPKDSKKLAEVAADKTETPEGAVFLVRLD